MVQRTLLSKTELACPCPTYVNASNGAVIAQMAALEQQLNQLGCSQYFACPAVPCPTVTGATCDPQTDTCVDTSGSAR